MQPIDDGAFSLEQLINLADSVLDEAILNGYPSDTVSAREVVLASGLILLAEELDELKAELRYRRGDV